MATRSRKWKYRERDAKLIRHYLDKHLEWSTAEQERCLDDWCLTRQHSALGQSQHWKKMSQCILFLLNCVQFGQTHNRPEDY